MAVAALGMAGTALTMALQRNAARLAKMEAVHQLAATAAALSRKTEHAQRLEAVVRSRDKQLAELLDDIQDTISTIPDTDTAQRVVAGRFARMFGGGLQGDKPGDTEGQN